MENDIPIHVYPYPPPIDESYIFVAGTRPEAQRNYNETEIREAREREIVENENRRRELEPIAAELRAKIAELERRK